MSYDFFDEMIVKIEKLQEALNQLRDVVKSEIQKCASQNSESQPSK